MCSMIKSLYHHHHRVSDSRGCIEREVIFSMSRGSCGDKPMGWDRIKGTGGRALLDSTGGVGVVECTSSPKSTPCQRPNANPKDEEDGAWGDDIHGP